MNGKNKNPETREASVSNRSPWLSVLHELYVDLLGSLVPGLFTVILGAALVVVTTFALYRFSINPDFSLEKIADLFKGEGLLGNLRAELAVIIAESCGTRP